MDAEKGDAFLIDGIKRGDQRAWRQLIERYQGRLLAFARSRAPSLADAEDVVQEAFVGFAASIANFDPTRSLETYLFTIARYKLFDLMRQRKLPTQSAPADAEDWWDRVSPDDGESPSRLAVTVEAAAQQRHLLADMLRRLIYEMRDRQAFDDLQVIELVFYVGRRNLDVAELLDIDQKAVAGIKFRAIGKLQRYLADASPDAVACLDEAMADVTVAQVWRENRLTCLKRSTLGAYLLGVLEEPWKSFTQFHLDVVGCPVCVANLQDLQAEEDTLRTGANTERMFASSVGFLKPQ
ncbi:MAG: sigma-70 family RNA polymerase sigma factor [Phycisphaerales bacterium]|nr:sigma-70 family RNA polymerase sigma factor [Phycisphaerales bacterium]